MLVSDFPVSDLPLVSDFPAPSGRGGGEKEIRENSKEKYKREIERKKEREKIEMRE